MTVKNATVWLALRDEIRAWMTQQGFGNQVYLTEAPTDEMTSQYAVQIIPKGDSSMHPRSGVGLMNSDIDIIVWWRNLMDPTTTATERIAGDIGIEQFIDGLRQLLIQNDLGGILTIALMWRNGGAVEQVPDLPGWMRGTETFSCAFEIPWSNS